MKVCKKLKKKCCVPECKGHDASIPFPEDPEKRKKWISILKLSKSNTEELEKSSNEKTILPLCLNHFSVHDISWIQQESTESTDKEEKDSNLTFRLDPKALPTFTHQSSGSQRSYFRIKAIRANNVNEKKVCEICGEKLARIDGLKKHMDRVHFKVKKKNCKNCEISCYNQSDLDKHILICKKTKVEKLLDCSKCKRKFYNKEKLQNHIKLLHKKHKYECLECKEQFNLKGLLLRHMKIVHNSHSKLHKCKLCDFIAAEPKTVRVHVERFHPDGEAPPANVLCSVCGGKFLTRRHMLLHFPLVHPDFDTKTVYNRPEPLKDNPVGKYRCKHCPETFHAQRWLIAHYKRSHFENMKELETWPCLQCDLKFMTRVILKRHLIDAHNVKNASSICNICGYHAENFDQIKRHRQREHIQCTQCKRTFDNHKNLSSHFKMDHVEVVNKRRLKINQYRKMKRKSRKSDLETEFFDLEKEKVNLKKQLLQKEQEVEDDCTDVSETDDRGGLKDKQNLSVDSIRDDLEEEQYLSDSIRGGLDEEPNLSDSIENDLEFVELKTKDLDNQEMCQSSRMPLECPSVTGDLGRKHAGLETWLQLDEKVKVEEKDISESEMLIDESKNGKEVHVGIKTQPTCKKEVSEESKDVIDVELRAQLKLKEMEQIRQEKQEVLESHKTKDESGFEVTIKIETEERGPIISDEKENVREIVKQNTDGDLNTLTSGLKNKTVCNSLKPSKKNLDTNYKINKKNTIIRIKKKRIEKTCSINGNEKEFDMESNNPDEADSRKKLNNDSAKLSCHICDAKFKLTNTLERHVFVKHSNESKSTISSECGKHFAEKVEVKDQLDHLKDVAEETTYSDCGEQFSNKDECKDHIDSVHKFGCNNCNRHFDSEIKLNLHLKSRHGKGPNRLACLGCDFKCHFIDKLRNHIMNDHVKEVSEGTTCSECGKKFTDIQECQIHFERSHKWVCETCGKVFLDKIRLRFHSVIHQPKRFVCETCGQAFKFITELNSHVKHKHVKLKKDEKKFKCKFCEYQSVRSNMIKRHMRSKHQEGGPPKELCLICSKKLVNLRKHVRDVHDKIEPNSEAIKLGPKVAYSSKCPICEKLIKGQACHVKRHIRQVHEVPGHTGKTGPQKKEVRRMRNLINAKNKDS